VTYENEKYVSERILNYNRAMGIRKQVLKPNLLRIQTRINSLQNLSTIRVDSMAAKLGLYVNEMNAE
jgi:hypothetical protein